MTITVNEPGWHPNKARQQGRFAPGPLNSAPALGVSVRKKI